MTDRRDPLRGAAAALLLGAMVGAMVAGRIETGVLCLGVALAATALAGAPRPSRAWLRTVGMAALVAGALNLYLAPGDALPGPVLFGRVPTIEGLALGALFALRLTGAAVAVHGLRSAWPGERAADEVALLLRPLEALRVPVGEARVMLGLAMRFAPLLASEASRIARLQDLRAGRPPRGVREWLARRRAATVPTLVHALERAEQVALALEARHYRLRPLPRGRGAGWAARAAGVALAAVALLWRGT